MSKNIAPGTREGMVLEAGTESDSEAWNRKGTHEIKTDPIVPPKAGPAHHAARGVAPWEEEQN